MNSSEYVLDICKQCGITVSKLEKACGFTNGYIKKLKNGLTPQKLKIVADVLEVNYNDLATQSLLSMKERVIDDINNLGKDVPKSNSEYSLLLDEPELTLHKSHEQRLSDYIDKLNLLSGTGDLYNGIVRNINNVNNEDGLNRTKRYADLISGHTQKMEQINNIDKLLPQLTINQLSIIHSIIEEFVHSSVNNSNPSKQQNKSQDKL